MSNVVTMAYHLACRSRWPTSARGKVRWRRGVLKVRGLQRARKLEALDALPSVRSCSPGVSHEFRERQKVAPRPILILAHSQYLSGDGGALGAVCSDLLGPRQRRDWHLDGSSSVRYRTLSQPQQALVRSCRHRSQALPTRDALAGRKHGADQDDDGHRGDQFANEAAETQRRRLGLVA